MRKYSFEITFRDIDLAEDEFTEELYSKSDNGLDEIKEILVTAVQENLFPNLTIDEVKEIVILKSYEKT